MGKQQASYTNAAATPASAQPPSEPNPCWQEKPKSTKITVHRPPPQPNQKTPAPWWTRS